MCNWKTNLIFGGKDEERKTDNININTGIFQGDCPSGLIFILCLLPLTWLLNRTNRGYQMKTSNNQRKNISHLFFMDDLKLFCSNDNQLCSLLDTVSMFSKDISMKFGLDKCNKLSMKKGKITLKGDIQIDDQCIKELKNENTYRYLGILERDRILHKDMNAEIGKEYFSRLKKVLKTELNAANIIVAINTLATSIFSYGYQVLDWSITELAEIDMQTRKQLKRNTVMHIRSNNQRLYLPRSQGGRGLLSIVDQFKKSTIQMSIYIKSSNTQLLKLVDQWTTTRKHLSIHAKANRYCEEVNLDYNEIRIKDKAARKRSIKLAFIQHHNYKLSTMKLHNQLQNEINQPYIDKTSTNAWIKDGKLKATTEATIFAIQEQAVTTNYIRKHHHKTTESDVCRLCHQQPETIHHIISGCSQLANNVYTTRHNNVAKFVHLRLGEKCKLLEEGKHRWYNHEPNSVYENETYKLLWDFLIQTDKKLKHNKLDIILYNKKEKTCKIIDIACPSDYNVIKKRREKLQNYTDLSIELKTIWNLNSVEIIPIIIGTTGVIYNGIKDELQKLHIFIDLKVLQRITLLGTAYVWRRFCELAKH